MIVLGMYYTLILIEKDTNYIHYSTQGTKVIDDECDYFQTSNIWLSAQKREQFQKLEEEINARKHMSRLNRKVNVTIDFTGREVIEENLTEDYEFDDEQLVDISEAVSMHEFEGSNICPDIEFDRPIVRMLTSLYIYH